MPGRRLPQGIDPLQFSGVIATAVQALQANKVVANVAHLGTILAVDIARGVFVGRGHGLHPHGGIEEGEVLAHVVDTLLAEGTRVRLSPQVLRKTAQMHDMTAFQPTQGLRALEHCLVTDGAVPLQSLGDAMVIVLD